MFSIFYGFFLNSDGFCLIVKRVLFLVYCLCVGLLCSVCVSSFDEGHLIDPRLVEAQSDLFQLRVYVSQFVDGHDVKESVQAVSSFDVIRTGEEMSFSEGPRDGQDEHVKGVPFYEVVRSFDRLEDKGF